MPNAMIDPSDIAPDYGGDYAAGSALHLPGVRQRGDRLGLTELGQFRPYLAIRMSGFVAGGTVLPPFRKRKCGNFKSTFVMTALPLAGVTVIEVRSEGTICLTMYCVLSTFFVSSLQDWRQPRTQAKSYKIGGHGLYVSTKLRGKAQTCLPEESVPSRSIQRSQVA